MRLRAISVLFLSALIVWAAPLAGLLLAGQSIAQHLPFPPRTQFAPHAPFAWSAFALLSVPVLGAVALYACALARARPAATGPARGHFPWWGWLGLALAAASWTFAWSEAALPPELRRHIFTPLWLGYILAMNALAFRSTGQSLLTHHAGWFLALFPVSALYWWLFEHLNRFAGNWHYVGIEAAGDWDYFLQGSAPFSTVLPAVASTWAWLRSFPRLDAMALPAVRAGNALAWTALAAGVLALAGVGLWPDALFSMLWLAPLALLAGLQQLVVGETVFAPLRRGDWRPILQPALAALVCGFFWELWNSGSLAQWRYSVPYVQRFHLFEMPLLGYAGYLPFGIECALVLDLVRRAVSGRGLWPPAR
jgi:hypothetical protein